MGTLKAQVPHCYVCHAMRAVLDEVPFDNCVVVATRCCDITPICSHIGSIVLKSKDDAMYLN